MDVSWRFTALSFAASVLCAFMRANGENLGQNVVFTIFYSTSLISVVLIYSLASYINEKKNRTLFVQGLQLQNKREELDTILNFLPTPVLVVKS